MEMIQAYEGGSQAPLSTWLGNISSGSEIVYYLNRATEHQPVARSELARLIKVMRRKRLGAAKVRKLCADRLRFGLELNQWAILNSKIKGEL